MYEAIDLTHKNTIPFDADQLSRLAQMYRDGMSAREISRVYGINQNSVIRRLATMGVKMRGRGREKGCVSWRSRA